MEGTSFHYRTSAIQTTEYRSGNHGQQRWDKRFDIETKTKTKRRGTGEGGLTFLGRGTTRATALTVLPHPCKPSLPLLAKSMATSGPFTATNGPFTATKGPVSATKSFLSLSLNKKPLGDLSRPSNFCFHFHILSHRGR